jgi:hypothetical protein
MKQNDFHFKQNNYIIIQIFFLWNAWKSSSWKYLLHIRRSNQHTNSPRRKQNDNNELNTKNKSHQITHNSFFGPTTKFEEMSSIRH